MKLLIKNAKYFAEDGEPVVQDILIEDGTIIQLGERISSDNIDFIDAKGSFVLPGLIDMNCNVCEPGYEQKDDISTVSKSAAKGGFTSICCLPGTKPAIDEKTVVSYVISQSRQLSRVNIFPYGSMTKGCLGTEMAEIGDMKKAGIVAVSDSNKTIRDADLLRNVFIYSKMFDLPLITFCDDEEMSGRGVINQGFVSAKTGLYGIPREAEEIIVARNILLAKYTRARLHITHVSTRGSVDIIRMAKKDGISVTADTCPHYFISSENECETYNTFAKVKPPLRTDDDIKAITEAIADGTIDVIVSGHEPETIESKTLEFDRATFGVSSVETAFALSYEALVKPGVITLRELAEKMSLAPAKILGFENKGCIHAGADADLVIIDTEGTYKITASEFASKAKYSMYDGREVSVGILYTIVDGKIAYLS